MSLKLANKILIVVIILLCACLNVQAQGKHFVLNSTHTFKVPNKLEGNIYKWYVLDAAGNQLKFNLVGDEYLISNEGTIEEIDGFPVNIKWSDVEIGEKYTLVLREEVARSGCFVESELEVTIINKNLNVDFATEESIRCADEGNGGFMIPLDVETAEGEVLADESKSYPLKVEFYVSYNGEPEEVVNIGLDTGTDITYDYSENKPGFKEDDSKDHVFEIRLKSVKDKHGAEMNINELSKFTFKAIAKPKLGDIQYEGADISDGSDGSGITDTPDASGTADADTSVEPTQKVAIGSEMTYKVDGENISSATTFHWSLLDIDGNVKKEDVSSGQILILEYTDDLATGKYRLVVEADNYNNNCRSDIKVLNIEIIEKPEVRILTKNTEFCSFSTNCEIPEEFVFEVGIEGYVGEWSFKYKVLDPDGNEVTIEGEVLHQVTANFNKETVSIILGDVFINNTDAKTYYKLVIEEITLADKGRKPVFVEDENNGKIGIMPMVKIGNIATIKIK